MENEEYFLEEVEDLYDPIVSDSNRMSNASFLASHQSNRRQESPHPSNPETAGAESWPISGVHEAFLA